MGNRTKAKPSDKSLVPVPDYSYFQNLPYAYLESKQLPFSFQTSNLISLKLHLDYDIGLQSPVTIGE